MKDFNKQGLEAFIRGGEKSPPPVFVGRELIIRDIEEAAAVGWKGEGADGHGRPGMTRIIQGAPGAGKSSILAELQSRSAETGKRPGQPRVIYLFSSSLMKDLPKVVAEIGAVASASKTDWLAMLANVTQRINSVDVFGMSLGLDRQSSGSPPHLGILKEKLPPAKWEAPVIVAVDEAQTLDPDKRSDHAIFLQDLHNASEQLPLTLVLAGLGDTRDVARGYGLTRGLNTHDIGGLAPSDVETLMTAFCRHFGLDPAGCEERLYDLAAPAEGWPRHLHFAMQALAREVLGTDGDLFWADWLKIGKEAAASRRRYYEDQISPEMRRAKRLTGAVLLGFRAGMDSADVVELIETRVRDEPGFRLPKGMDADSFLACLTHNGALQRTAYDGMASPIPSFRGYLIAAAAPTPDPAPEIPGQDEFARLLEKAEERLQLADWKLSHGFIEDASRAALTDPDRSAFSRLEQAGGIAVRILANAPDGGSALADADRRRAEAAAILREALRPAADDPDADTKDRLWNAIAGAAREITAARLVPGIDPDYERRRARIDQQVRTSGYERRRDPAPSPDSGTERKRDDDSPSPR